MTKPKRKTNPRNERIKRRYAEYLKEARRLSEVSVDKVLAAIDRFETDNQCRDFAPFRIEHAIRFKSRLGQGISGEMGRPLAKGTINAILKALRAFFIWLADQPGYRSKVRYSDADYFNASDRDQRLARSGDERPSPSIEQIHHVLSRMPAATPVQKRDRAIVAFLLLTGIRDGAAIGLKLKHVAIVDRAVRQDAREVATKFAKSMTTWFFPVGSEIEAIFADYIRFLREEALFAPDDPLFPRTRIRIGAGGSFSADGLLREFWTSAKAMRGVVKQAFQALGMPGYGPHSFRKTLARLGQSVCTSPEEMKAWSQNLGHEEVLTTFTSYGQVPGDRQRTILARMSQRKWGR